MFEAIPECRAGLHGPSCRFNSGLAIPTVGASKAPTEIGRSSRRVLPGVAIGQADLRTHGAPDRTVANLDARRRAGESCAGGDDGENGKDHEVKVSIAPVAQIYRPIELPGCTTYALRRNA